MTTNKIAYREGLFGSLTPSGWTPLSALQLWEARKSGEHPALQKVELLSFGRIEFDLSPPLDGNPEIRLEGFVSSDGVRIPVSIEKPLDFDYAATPAAVIPLQVEYASNIERELRPLLNSRSDLEPEVIATALIKVSTHINLKLNFTNEFFDYLSSPPSAEIPSPTDSELWEYQKYGFSWMFRLWQSGLGGILGDEMGVGKTLQLIALSCKVSSEGKGPALLVVPSGLLMKWCKDFVDHAPSFMASVHVHHGPNRPKSPRLLAAQKIILTTYSMLVQDQDVFSQIDFASVACDEAHELKESRTLKSQAVRSLHAIGKYLATGTPIQNNLGDYWTLIDIIEPGILGSRESFEMRAQDTPSLAMSLVEQTKHRILRRTQEQVGIQIPEGQEFYVPLVLSDSLVAEYRSIGRDNSIAPSTNGGHGALQYKRQFCAHPSVFQEPPVPGVGAKAEYLRNELSKISEVAEKIVIFVADFNLPRDLYREQINREFPNFWTGTIDGRTPNDLRHVLLEEFNEFDGPAALLINPLVGGQGLDIVAANHVFHMNPAWNPAKTDQATFRVTRPGQTRETWSHHLYYVETIEESIHNLVLNKRELSEAALEIAEAEAEKNQDSLINYLRK